MSISDDRLVAAVLALGVNRSGGPDTPEALVERYFAVLSHLRAAHDLHRTAGHEGQPATTGDDLGRRLAEGESPD